ncbi:hypothetical protein [Candidatus Lokiarchaeum ossiferum]|uniref:hypothetical protein n=1 Tax=Candidatus Lokiarchaeum ossiferum TaxID=2951803 RepID=UPI00352E5169
MKKNMKVLILISSFLLSSTSFVVITSEFLTKQDYFGTYKLETSDIGKFKNVELYYLASDLDVNIKIIPNATKNIYEANWNITYTQKSARYPLELIFSEKIDNDILKISISRKNKLISPIKELIFCDFTVYIDPCYENYSIGSNSKAGNFKIQAKNASFAIFDIQSSSGDINLNLDQCSIRSDLICSSKQGNINLFMDFINFSQNIFCESSTGAISSDSWNILFKNPAIFEVKTKSEKLLDFRWASHFEKKNNVEVLLENGGIIETRYWAPNQSTNFIISSQITEEHFKLVTPTGFLNKTGSNYYTTKKSTSPNADNIYFSLNSLNSKCYIKVVPCFKPIRICGTMSYWDSIPRERWTSGNYTIGNIASNPPKIKLINQTSFFNIKIACLNSSSSNLGEAYWNFSNMIGNMYGFGEIIIKFEEKLIDDTLEIKVYLEYAKDKILPVFKHKELIIYFNPKYSISMQ